MNDDRINMMVTSELRQIRELIMGSQKISSERKREARIWAYRWPIVKEIIERVDKDLDEGLGISRWGAKMSRFLKSKSKGLSPESFDNLRDDDFEYVKEDLIDIADYFKHANDVDSFDVALDNLYEWAQAYKVWIGS